MEGDIKFGDSRATGGAYSVAMGVDARHLVLERGTQRLAMGTVGAWMLASIESGINRNQNEATRFCSTEDRVRWLTRFWKSKFQHLTT